MAWIRIGALASGAVLVRPLLDPAGRVVVAAGVPLGAVDVERVRRSTLEGVDVVEPGAFVAIDADVKRTYRNNDRAHPAVERLALLTRQRRLARATGAHNDAH